MKKFSFMLALFLFCGLGYAKKTGAPPATKALTSNGVVAYGNILGPAAEVGYVQFDVDRIKSKSLVSSSMPTGLYGGGYHDGKLYAYQVNETTEGVPQDVTFYVFNATTGAVISQTPRSELYGKIVDAVAYDYSGNTMYAVEGNKLYTMDLSAGTLTKVDSITGVNGKLLAMAIDLDGTIFGINDPPSGTTRLYNIDKTTAVATEIGSTNRSNVQNPQSMGFNYDDGTLYWCENTTSSANFLKVNTKTGQCNPPFVTNTYAMTCFFIPYKVGQPTGVTDLTLTPGASGALSATLSWKNPDKTIAGQTLEELTAVKIYEDDNTTPVQTISTLTIGGTSQCTVTVTNAKNYKYTVVAENSFGETQRTVSGWIGPDVPAAPKNVVLTANGMIGTLNWTAPTIGLNGGWFDASTLTYTIVRLAKDTVAKGIAATTYVDNTVTKDSMYTYKVIAVNGKGKGGVTTSNQSVLGAPKTVPYTMGFETGEAYNRWAIEDANENVSVVTWARYTVASSAHTGSASMRYAGQGLEYAGNDWLFSPKITLETGKNYRIKFWTRSFSTIYAENIACYIASGQHSSLVIGEPVWRKENLIQNTYFEVDIPLQDYAGGDYSFAIHAYSDSLMAGLYVDDFSITELSGEDAVAVKLFGNDSVMAGKSFIYKAMVKNNGASTLTDYTVKLVGASNQVLATGTSLPNIASCESAWINFSWTPTTAGDFTLRAIVETSGDADVSNDTTNQILVKVTPANDLYEVSIGTKGTGVAPNNGQYLVPFNFYYKSGKAQTLYFDHELIGQSGVITEIQYFNKFTSDNAIDKPVQIWMANTTLDRVDTAWIPDSEFTLVYDGTKTFPKGNNTISFTLDYPFEYTGKNLAIMTIRPENIMHAPNDIFFVSQDFDFSGRTRYYWPNDYEDFDVTHRGIMHPLHYYPNMVVKMGFEGGSVSGTVTDGENPLAGATVQVVGTTMKRTTDENGQYNFEFLLPGDYQFKMTKHGYNDSISPLATITVDNNSTVDFSTRSTDVYTVSGRVSSSSAPYPAGMEGVQITLSGYEDYTTSTDASGNYAISGIYSGYTYDVHIKHPGYVVYDSAVTVQDKDTTFLISLKEYTPVVLNAVAKKENNNAVITWTKPQISSFRYDNGMMTGQIGFSSGSSNLSIFGSAHRTSAILDKMSWYITNETQHTHVDLFVFGLDSNGIPNALDSIYFVKNIPNTNGQWCEYEFPEPLEVPNGFFIGMSASDGGFLSLGMDSTTDESPFRYATHYVTPKYTDFFFSPLESVAANMLKNPMIRAEGLSLGDISFDAMQKAVQTSSERKNFAGYAPVFIPSAPAETEPLLARTSTSVPMKATTTIPANYVVYRITEGQAETDWEQLATPTDTSYTDTDFSTLTAGVYQYAVQAVYAVNNPAKAVKTNIITKDMEFEVDMRVSTNSGDDVSGATVVLTHQDGNPAHVYTLTATDSIVVFPQVWKGLYNISINLANFEPYTLNNFSVQADTSLKVKLTEIILEPYGLRITGDAKDRLFAWNTYERFFDDMENQTNFEYQNIPPYTLINVDDAETNTFVTTVFPNSGYIGSYIVFNPSQTTLTSPSANPYSGYKYLACFAKKTPKIPNNDWLILPKKLIVDGVKLKFQAKTYTQQSGYSPERIRVAVSTTGTNVSDFTVISSGDYIEVPATMWTEYSFDLSAYAGQEVYLAINCVSDNGFMFMLDDISVDIETDKSAQKSFENYTVYLNGEEITTTSATQHQFTDLADGDYTAGVSTTYSSGTTSIKTIDFVVDQSSIAITQTGNFTIYPNPVTDILNIETTQTITEINVFDQNGRIVKTQKGNQKTLDLQNLPTGQYVVRIHAGGAVVPVKIIKK